MSKFGIDNIEPILSIIKQKKLNRYIKKIDDIYIENNMVVVKGKLNNKHIIKLLLDTKTEDVYINLYGDSLLPIKFDNKIRHKFLDIVTECLETISTSNKADIYLYLLRFFFEAMKYLGNPHNGYTMDDKLERIVKIDIHGLFFKLDGFGKTEAYRVLMIKYHDVIM